MTLPLLVITPGDPLGIGPEVSCRALLERSGTRALLVGDARVILAEARQIGLHVEQVDRPVGGNGVTVFEPSTLDEPVEIAAIRCAVEQVQNGGAKALVTGPINKQKLVEQGFSHKGHTEFLGELCNVESPVMAFVGGPVRVALATTHIPISAVANALSVEGVRWTIEAAYRALVRDVGIPSPRIAVCGLNPHAGDGGVLGHEEIEIIQPAIARAREAGIQVEGPISAETVFRMALGGEYDMIIAMYHDQGLVPLKALGFGDSVNWTLGLPMIRTSVDHGTAYDIAGKRQASPSSMLAAMDWASTLCNSSR
jgi:4-hydroxythreonine-4-phosphate dehydrogenase